MTDYDVHGHLPRGKNINNDFLFLHLITNHLFLYVRANSIKCTEVESCNNSLKDVIRLKIKLILYFFQ